MDIEALSKQVIAEVEPYTMVAGLPLRFTIESTLDCIDRDVPGCILELGTWRGGSSFAMLLAQRYRYGEIRKPVWMFDSFEGLPPATQQDGPMALAWQADTDSPNYIDNCKAPLDGVRQAVAKFGFTEDECRIVPGWFNETVPPLIPAFGQSRVGLLRVDCDWYEPVRFVLESLMPCVSDEARVIIDDYYAWDGCARATHDFLSSNDVSYRLRSIEGFGAAWFEKRTARTGPL